MLENDNILLRAIEPEDIDFILKMENNSDLWKVSNTHSPFSRFDIEQYVMSLDKDIYSSKQLRLLIVEKQKNTSVGLIDLFGFDAHNKRAGIGILVTEGNRKMGVATIALELLKTYAFSHLNLHQLYCNIRSDNPHSISLFERKGFSRCGVKLDWNLDDGKWVDEYMYQIINYNQNTNK